jgi:hypothetical protein
MGNIEGYRIHTMMTILFWRTATTENLCKRDCSYIMGLVHQSRAAGVLSVPKAAQVSYAV